MSIESIESVVSTLEAIKAELLTIDPSPSQAKLLDEAYAAASQAIAALGKLAS